MFFVDFERIIQMWIGNECIDLQLVLIDSAQCFSWKKVNDAFYAAISGSAVKLYRDLTGIYAEGADAEFARYYLDLDRNYAKIATEFEHISAVSQAIRLYSGMRILKQDAWETLISFILSANNNVSRIRNLVEKLSQLLGEKYFIDGVELYALPSPETLGKADEAELRSIGVGYRAPYLIETAKRVCDGFPLDKLCEMDYESAHELLVTLPGVGDKVADCVQLFACGHSCAFPVDVWVERLLESWFGFEKASRKKMSEQARKLLGNNCGIMQQYLFHAARIGDIKL